MSVIMVWVCQSESCGFLHLTQSSTNMQLCHKNTNIPKITCVVQCITSNQNRSQHETSHFVKNISKTRVFNSKLSGHTITLKWSKQLTSYHYYHYRGWENYVSPKRFLVCWFRPIKVYISGKEAFSFNKISLHPPLGEVIVCRKIQTWKCLRGKIDIGSVSTFNARLFIFLQFHDVAPS